MYVLGGGPNVNAADSDAFEGCPKGPVASDFLDGGAATPGFDLTAAGANFAITLHRTPEVWIGGHRSWIRGSGVRKIQHRVNGL